MVAPDNIAICKYCTVYLVVADLLPKVDVVFSSSYQTELFNVRSIYIGVSVEVELKWCHTKQWYLVRLSFPSENGSKLHRNHMVISILSNLQFQCESGLNIIQYTKIL